MSLQPGSIVKTYLDDPDGKPIDHDHPAVVMVLFNDGEDCEVIAISTKLHLGETQYHVAMPCGHNAKSGLTEECVAKPEWSSKLPVGECVKIGYIPTKRLAQVRASFERYKQEREASPAEKNWNQQ